MDILCNPDDMALASNCLQPEVCRSKKNAPGRCLVTQKTLLHMLMARTSPGHQRRTEHGQQKTRICNSLVGYEATATMQDVTPVSLEGALPAIISHVNVPLVKLRSWCSCEFSSIDMCCQNLAYIVHGSTGKFCTSLFPCRLIGSAPACPPG